MADRWWSGARRSWGTANSLAVLVLAAALAIRIYAAFWTVPLRTWDDFRYRLAAWGEYTHGSDSIGSAVAAILLPESRTLQVGATYGMLTQGLGTRIGGTRYLITVGYQDLLVFGLAASPAGGDPERAFQAVNLVLLCLEAIAVFLLFRWARSRIELPATALYVTAPFVFGMNRCVLTENHVMLAMLSIPLASVLLVSSPQGSRPMEALKGAAAGVLLGVLSSTREYVAPTVVALAFVTPLALLVARRFLAGAAFIGCASPFLWATSRALARALPSIFDKVDNHPEYANTFAALLPHMAVHVLGPAQTALLVAGAVVVGREVVRGWRDVDSRPLRLVLAALAALALAYSATVVASVNRSGRLTLPVAFSLLAAIPIAMRLRGWTPPRIAPLALVAALLCSATLLSYDLFVAYDGGATYAARPYGLDFWSHPLHLRELRGPNDKHVIEEPPPAAPGGQP